MLLSYNIQQKWLVWILWEDSVFSHVVDMPHRIHLNYEKTPKLKHTELPCKLFFGKSQEENVNLYCP
jgi:hypothetical protein